MISPFDIALIGLFVSGALEIDILVLLIRSAYYQGCTA